MTYDSTYMLLQVGLFTRVIAIACFKKLGQHDLTKQSVVLIIKNFRVDLKAT